MKPGRKNLTKEYLLKKLKEGTAILGRGPCHYELKKLGLPSRGAYRNHFGSFNAAKKILGIPLSGRAEIICKKCGKKFNVKYSKRNKTKTCGRSCFVKPKLNKITVKAPLALRFKILSRDGFRCQYCGRSSKNGAILEIDHINPIASGGLATEENLITSCFECNSGKGDHLLMLHNTESPNPNRIFSDSD